MLCSAQIIVPDRLPDGRRMEPLTTPADWGTLAYDSLRALPPEEGGRDTWWHRHALFVDGPVQVTMDPVLDVSRDARRTIVGEENPTPETAFGYRNVRGVRYTGSIDKRVRFGGKVLEMQRLLVAPETEYILAAQEYPGLGPGKLRPAENGLFSMDHSLAEVWFDAQPKKWLQIQWGLGATQLGPGTRHLLWNGNRAPAPYLLLIADLGKGWTWQWLQSRERGLERLPPDGAREGRYHPLGLGLRSITKTIRTPDHQLDITFMSAQWTDVLQRGQLRSGLWDWTAALAPLHIPGPPENASNRYLAAHMGMDIQWRRPHSTWYGQLRLNPTRDDRYAQAVAAHEMEARQWMVGHIRHGDRWTIWTEWAPRAASTPVSLSALVPTSPLGIQPWSPWLPDFIQGAEVRIAGTTLSAEAGRVSLSTNSNTTPEAPSLGWTWKCSLGIPSASADAVNDIARNKRSQSKPNRWWPPFVPLTPFASVMHCSGMQQTWWTIGVTSPAMRSRKSY